MFGILLVAHGSKTGNSGAEALKDMISADSGIETALCFKRFGKPNIRDALNALSDSGVDKLAVIPLFMGDGRYVGSIPRNLGLWSDRGTVTVHGRKMDVIVSKAVGLHPGICDAAVDLVEAISEPGTLTGVVILGHGNPLGGNLTGIADHLSVHGYLSVTVTGRLSEDLRPAVEGLLSAGCESVVILPARMTHVDVSRWTAGAPCTVTEPLGTSQAVADMVCDMARRLLG